MKNNMLFVNCSESTCRLDISELSDKEVEGIQKRLMQYILTHQNAEGDEEVNLDIHNKTLEEVENEYGEEAYETYLDISEVWGVKTLTIKGDFPYNKSDQMEAFAEDNNLKSEWEEN